MTALASTSVDWTVLDRPEVVEACQDAALIASRKFGDRAVASLAEVDDLIQEAYILVATRPNLRGVDRGLLRYQLVKRLMDQIKHRFRSSAGIVRYEGNNE